MFSADARIGVDSFLYRCSNSSGEYLVGIGGAEFVSTPEGRRAIRLLPPDPRDKAISEHIRESSALLPFYRRQNPLMSPPKLHYSIGPNGGLRFHGLRTKFIEEWHAVLVRRIIKVSVRKIDFTAASYIKTPGRVTMPHRIDPSSSLNQVEA